MAAHAAVGVDDDLPAGDAGVAHGAADDEAAGRVDVELGLLVEQPLRQRLGDDQLADRLVQLLVGDLLGVLGGDDHRVDADRLAVAYSTVTWLLPSGRRKSSAALADLGELPGHGVGVLDRHRHQLGRLVAGVAEHHALVAGALPGVDALGDVGRLLVDRHQHRAGVGVEAHGAVGVADLADGLADQARVVEPGAGGDLAGQHHEAGLDQRLAGHPRPWGPAPGSRRGWRRRSGRPSCRDGPR